MLEYPSIINSSKAPREYCYAFDKLDGSNVRVKFSHKNGFSLFGSRHELIDESHPFLAGAISSFRENFENRLIDVFIEDKRYKDLFKKVKEIICFGEYVGDNSYAGKHDVDDPTRRFVLFDVLLIHKAYKEFLKPQEFIKIFENKVEIPRLVYEGNLNQTFIDDVRANKFNLKEGVICKGAYPKGNFVGKVWMCKIKTQEYLDKLRANFGEEWEKYAE